MSIERDLYRLIKSMTKAEKRQFTLSAQSSKEKKQNYLILYEAINSLSEFDEEKLKKKLRKQPFFERIAVEGHYLYSVLLKSIRNSIMEHSIDGQIKELIRDAKLLRNRGLLDMSLVALEKAEKLANKYNEHLAILEINIQKRPLIKKLDKKNPKAGIAKIHQEKEEALGRLVKEFELLDLHDELLLRLKETNTNKDLPIDPELEEKFFSFFSTYNNSNASFSINLRELQTKAYYEHMQGNTVKTNTYYLEALGLWEAHPLFKKEEFFRFRVELSNLVQNFIAIENFDNAWEIIEKYEIPTPQNYQDELLNFYIIAELKMMYYLNYPNLEAAIALVPFIQKGLDKYFLPENKRGLYLCNIAIVHLFLNDIEGCNFWLKKLITDNKKSHIRKDLKRLGRLLLIVCEYQLDDKDNMLKRIRAVKNYYKNIQPEKATLFEEKVLHFLIKLANAPKMEEKNIFKAFKSYLEEENSNPWHTIGLEDLTMWVNSHIEGTTMLDQLKKARAR